MFNMLAARYIVFSDAGADWIAPRLRTERGSEHYRLVQDFGAQKIYENTHALNRVNFASHWEIFENSEALFRRMREQAFDPTTTVLLTEARHESAPPPSTPHAGTPIDGVTPLFHADRGNIEIEVEAAKPGIVWISDCYYPGWKVYVDGIEKPMLRVNHAFRGVYVEEGKHGIRMAYQPTSFTVGLVGGAFGVLFAVIQLVRPWKRPPLLTRASSSSRDSAESLKHENPP
jgi:hypothetical protein